MRSRESVEQVLADHPGGAWTADEIVVELMHRGALYHRSTVCLALGEMLDHGRVRRFMYHGADVWQVAQ